MHTVWKVVAKCGGIPLKYPVEMVDFWKIVKLKTENNIQLSIHVKRFMGNILQYIINGYGSSAAVQISCPKDMIYIRADGLGNIICISQTISIPEAKAKHVGVVFSPSRSHYWTVIVDSSIPESSPPEEECCRIIRSGGVHYTIRLNFAGVGKCRLGEQVISIVDKCYAVVNNECTSCCLCSIPYGVLYCGAREIVVEVEHMRPVIIHAIQACKFRCLTRGEVIEGVASNWKKIHVDIQRPTHSYCRIQSQPVCGVTVGTGISGLQPGRDPRAAGVAEPYIRQVSILIHRKH
jgi:hypothetical protein